MNQFITIPLSVTGINDIILKLEMSVLYVPKESLLYTQMLEMILDLKSIKDAFISGIYANNRKLYVPMKGLTEGV